MAPTRNAWSALASLAWDVLVGLSIVAAVIALATGCATKDRVGPGQALIYRDWPSGSIVHCNAERCEQTWQ
jgi:hypothetical protein